MIPVFSNLLEYLGFLPSAHRYEQQRRRMEDRHAQYHSIAASEAFKRFLELGQSDMPNDRAEAKKQRREYRKLKKSGTVKTYYRLEKKYKAAFEEIDSWTTVFVDEFQDSRLNAQWNIQPFWSLKMPMAGYVQNTECHNINPNNVAVENNTLRITTQPAVQQSMAWDPRFGFIPQQFDYSSGMVNTAQQFECLYGKIEVKLRVPSVKNVYHALWLSGSETTPAISVFNYCNRFLETGIYQNTGNDKYSRRIGLYADRFYVIEMEWDKQSITWRLNGKEWSKKVNTLHAPLYLHLSSGIVGTPPLHKLPCHFEISRIKVYRKIV